jgi:F-type H+-transporting ATPase subunit delta
VQQALRQSREAASILQNPGFTQQHRHAAVEALASALRLSPLLVNFLRLLVDRQRSADLAAIARAYRAMLDEKVGRVRATVTSAQPLAAEDLQQLSDAIARFSGREIVLEAKTDPSLIGGVTAQVGPTLLDGSLRTQLERLREELKHAPS